MEALEPRLLLTLNPIARDLVFPAVHAVDPATIGGHVVADNFHRVYTGSPTTGVTPRGNVGIFPDEVPYDIITDDDFLFLAAWSDEAIQQGLLADFTINGQPVLSGDPAWDVCATGADLDTPEPPSDTLLEGAVCRWVGPTVAGPNEPFLGAPFPLLDPNALPMWHDLGGQPNPPAPFQPGFDHGEFLVFRLQLAPVFEDGPPATAVFKADDPDPDDTPASLRYQLTSEATAGNVTNLSNGSFLFDPGNDFQDLRDGQTRTAQFTYQATDALGLASNEATATIRVTGLNDAPQAKGDNYATGQKKPLEVDAGGGLLVNDADIDAGETALLFVSAFDAVSNLGAAVSVKNDGSFSYDPTAALKGLTEGQRVVDTFSYTVQDPLGATDTATATISVTGVNDAPLANDDNYATDEDTRLDVDAVNGLLRNDTDPDAGETALLSVFAFDAVSKLGAEVMVDILDGSFSYDPTPVLQGLREGQTVEDTFTYTILDPFGAQSTADVTITVTGVNDAPLAADDNYGINEDTRLDVPDPAFGLLANDTDPDIDETGLLAVFSFDAVSTLGAAVSVNVDGSFTYDPTSSSLLQSLDVNQLVDDTFAYTVEDPRGAMAAAIATVGVLGRNDPPVAADDRYLMLANQTELDIPANLGVLLNDVDPERNPITARLVDPPAAGSLMLAGNGAFLYQLNDPTVTSDQFTYQAIDDRGAASNTATATIEVAGTTVEIVDGDLFITDIVPGGKDDTLFLRWIVGGENGGMSFPVEPGESDFVESAAATGFVGPSLVAGTDILIISDGAGNLIANLTGAAGVGSTEVVIPLDAVTGDIVFHLFEGHDTVEIDLSGLPPDQQHRSLSVVGGTDPRFLDTVIFSGQNNLGTGAVETDAGVDEVFVNGSLSTAGAPITLLATRSIEVNADMQSGGGAVQLMAGFDIFGNCSLIDAGGSPIVLNGRTAVAGVRARTPAGNVSIRSTAGGIAGCPGLTDVEAATVTLEAAASIGTAELIEGVLRVHEPFRTDVTRVQATAGGLGIFIEDVGGCVDELAVDATEAPPLGRVQVPPVCPAPNGPSPEGESSPWQNRVNRLDVNHDTFVSPHDVLAAVNFINDVGMGQLASLPTGQRAMMYVDVNGDLSVSPGDVLQVVNHLNRADLADAEGEGWWQVEEPGDPQFAGLSPQTILITTEPSRAPLPAARANEDAPPRHERPGYAVARQAVAIPQTNRQVARRAPARDALNAERAWAALDSLLDDLATDVAPFWRPGEELEFGG